MRSATTIPMEALSLNSNGRAVRNGIDIDPVYAIRPFLVPPASQWGVSPVKHSKKACRRWMYDLLPWIINFAAYDANSSLDGENT
jgi:hypothetical protein